MRLRVWIIPFMELADVARIFYFDNPIMRRIQANDPLVKPGPYYTMGDPGNILSDSKDWKVLDYKPNFDTNKGELLVEEVL